MLLGKGWAVFFFHYAAIVLKISAKGDTLKDFVIIRDYWGLFFFENW